MRLLDDRLKAFLKISQLGTVQGAGQIMGLTQTAVTQRIRSLEREFKITLFTRSRKGMRLTSEGQALLQYCRGAEDLEGAIFSKFSGNSKDAEIQLTLAGPTSIMTSRVVKNLEPILRSNPNLYIHLLIDDDSNLLDLLRTDRAQLAIVTPALVPLEMDSKSLHADRYVLVATNRWKGRRLTDILENERIIDFYQGDKTTLNYLRKYDLDTNIKRQRLFVNDNGALMNFFERGLGFGTLEYNLAIPLVDSGKLILLNKGQIWENPAALVWYPRPQAPSYFSEIVRAIK